VSRLIRRPAHEPKDSTDALVRDDVEIGRLLELDGEGLAEGAVEDIFAGRVHEVGEDEGVARGEHADHLEHLPRSDEPHHPPPCP